MKNWGDFKKYISLSDVVVCMYSESLNTQGKNQFLIFILMYSTSHMKQCVFIYNIIFPYLASLL